MGIVLLPGPSPNMLAMTEAYTTPSFAAMLPSSSVQRIWGYHSMPGLAVTGESWGVMDGFTDGQPPDNTEDIWVITVVSG